MLNDHIFPFHITEHVYMYRMPGRNSCRRDAQVQQSHSLMLVGSEPLS